MDVSPLNSAEGYSLSVTALLGFLAIVAGASIYTNNGGIMAIVVAVIGIVLLFISAFPMWVLHRRLVRG